MTQKEKKSIKPQGIVISVVGLIFLAIAVLLWVKSIDLEAGSLLEPRSEPAAMRLEDPALLVVSQLSELPGVRLSYLDRLARPLNAELECSLDEKTFFGRMELILNQHGLKMFSRGDLGSPTRLGLSLGRFEPEVILNVNLSDQVRNEALIEPVDGEISLKTDRARVVLVLDDAGGDGALQWLFIELPLKLNFAVIPGLANSHLFAKRALQAGHQVLIHLPMQPLDPVKGENEGQMLRSGMPATEINRLLDGAMRSVPGAVALNNHMGSAATSDRVLMELLMPAIKARGLIFLDSLTHSDSVAADEAVSAGLPFLRRDVFLDHVRERRAVEDALAALVRQAREKGSAIGIGHVTSMETWQVLRDQLEAYAATGIDFIGITEL